MAMQIIMTIIIKKKAKLPSKYKLFKIVFKLNNLLSKYRKHDHIIPLKEGKLLQI